MICSGYARGKVNTSTCSHVALDMKMQRHSDRETVSSRLSIRGLYQQVIPRHFVPWYSPSITCGSQYCPPMGNSLPPHIASSKRLFSHSILAVSST
jgi:hypothetical protein